MSYILEALKKSSEERARLSAVDARPDPAPVSTSHERRAFAPPWRLIAVLGLAFLIVMVVIGLRTNEPEVRPESAEARPVLPEERPSLAADTPAPAVVPAAPEEEAPEMVVDSVKHHPKHAVPAKQDNEPALRTPQRTAAEPVAPAPVLTKKIEPAVSSGNVPATAPKTSGEMPPELLRQVRAIHIAAHVYSSTPANRMVIIDGKAVREGDTLASGIVIEQITPTGITVAYKGYHADRPIN